MDIMHIESSFKFHPVGFGLFTSGKIESFRFVYDCGSRSKTKVNNCIELEYPKEEKINLDLLSISQFHSLSIIFAISKIGLIDPDLTNQSLK